MKHIMFTFVLLVQSAAGVVAETCIVKDGQPRAQIVIAENPSRSTRLAAQELQTYIEKISGARLAISSKWHPYNTAQQQQPSMIN